MAITKQELSLESSPKNEIQALAETAVSRGTYSNLAIVSHSQEEFVLDFLLRVQGQTQLVSRIILSPAHAERLAKALNQNIAKQKQRPKPAQKADMKQQGE